MMVLKTQLIALGKKENKNIHEDNVGVDRIASFLCDKGFPTRMTFMYTNETDEAFKKIDTTCNFFGITLHSENLMFCIDLSKKIRQLLPHAWIFVGGIFATYAAKEILNICKDVDFVVMGHGDIPLFLLYQEILSQNGNVEEAINKSKYICSRNNYGIIEPCYSDVNQHLLPQREYLANSDKTVVCVIGSHGCYGNCSFCTVPEPGAKVTERGAMDMFNEIEEIYKKYNVKFFYFLDSAIEGWGEKGKQRISLFCDIINKSKIKLSFRAFIRAESFKNNKKDIMLLKKMKEAGFVNLIVGIEAGNDNDLQIYNKRCNLKDVKTCLSVFDSINYNIFLGFIILNPYTTYEDLKANYYLLSNTKFSLLHNYINCLQVNVNTPIYYQMKSDGLLLDTSIYSSGYDYICLDQNTQHVFEFIKSNFLLSEILQRDFEFNNQLNHMQYIINVLNDCTEYGDLICLIRSKINTLVADFFKYLFIDLNFVETRGRYQNFIDTIYNIYDETASLHNKLLKKFLKANIRREQYEHTNSCINE